MRFSALKEWFAPVELPEAEGIPEKPRFDSHRMVMVDPFFLGTKLVFESVPKRL